MIITEKSQGHQVAFAMESVPMGDAKAAYAAFFQHCHRSTAAGRHEVTCNFYNATMANTNSNIIEWLAMVPRRGKLLELVGGRADDGDRVSVLIGGLLPEFKQLITNCLKRYQTVPNLFE